MASTENELDTPDINSKKCTGVFSHIKLVCKGSEGKCLAVIDA